MLSAFLTLLLLGNSPGIAAEGRFPEAAEVYRCRFEADADKDFDTWPDGWTRERGPGFPSYTKIRIQAAESAGGDNCLRIDLDGGGAAAFSPPIPVNISYGYILEAYLRTEELKHDGAFLSLTFLDAEKHTLSTSQSEPVTRTGGWKKIHLGTIETTDRNARWIVVGLHVKPGDEADLHGVVCFSDVWLGRLPRMEMKTNHPHNLFLRPAKATVTCTASGLDGRFSEVAFELLDCSGASLSKETRPLALETSAANQNRACRRRRLRSVRLHGGLDSAAARTGLLPRSHRAARRRGDGRSAGNHFGVHRIEPAAAAWHIRLEPAARRAPLALPELAELLKQTGISWVKYPLWCSEEDGGRQLEKIFQFTENLRNAGIEVAGMLLEPPEPARDEFGGIGPLTAAKVFDSEPKRWFPSLEPVIIQLSNKVHYWQLGRDADWSLLVLPNRTEKLKAIRGQLDHAMQGMELGIGWDWRQGLPSGTGAAELPWNFVSISSNPPLTDRELAAQLEAGRQSPVKSWVVISPTARGELPLQTRAEDLVGRMVTAKVHGADAAFCPDPFDPKRGLMNPDGTPGELFIPWRTAALEIGGAQFIGEMILPRGSRNWLFVREKDAVLYVWNSRPVEEILYLGERVEQTGIWGRSERALELDGHQLINVDRRPAFVTGINKPVAQWCVGLQIEKKRLSSVFGQSQPNGFTVDNPFPNAVSGKAVIVPPRDWIIVPREMIFQAAANEKVTQKFQVNLPSDANNGENTVRIDFEIQADRPYRFSVYRKVEVGTNDVRIEVQTRLNERNELEVVQHFINETDKPLSFRCELSAPDRRRLMTQILRQGRGEETQVYRLEDGNTLLGKPLWLRAEEIDGPRILNYRFEAGK